MVEGRRSAEHLRPATAMARHLRTHQRWTAPLRSEVDPSSAADLHLAAVRRWARRRSKDLRLAALR